MSARLDRIAGHGDARAEPYVTVDWARADPDRPWLPPDLLGVACLGARAAESEMIRRLSRLEFAQLAAAGLWLEGLFIARIGRLDLLSLKAAEARVLLQEIREEASHSLVFLEAIEQAGLGGVELLGPRGVVDWLARRLDPARAPFWAMTFLGESVTDAFAIRALRSEQTICPAAQQILRAHHRDEARHIAAAKAMAEERLANLSRLDRLSFAPVMTVMLRSFLRATFYPTVSALRAIGIADAEAAAAAARACPRRRAVVDACAAPALATLRRMGLPTGRIGVRVLV